MAMLGLFKNRRGLSVCLIGAMALLTSCDWFGDKDRQPPAKHPPRIEASAFIKSLSLARLAVVQDDEVALKKHAKTLENYTAQKSQKAVRQSIVMLEYRTEKTSALQRLIIPIRVPVEKPEFPALLEVMKRLGKQPHTLHDVRLHSLTVAPGTTLKLTGMSLGQARRVLDERQRLLLKARQKLDPIEEARSLLQLTRFFMTHRFRDAAYLSLDNAKQVLANATRDASVKESHALEDLTQQLSVLEVQLRETLPF